MTGILKMNKDQILAKISEVKTELEDKQSMLSDIEVNPEQYANLDSQYDDFLDEMYSEACDALPISVTGSQLIAEFDPVMYRFGFSDFCSEYRYQDLDIYQTTESNIEDLESELSELEDMLEYLEDEEIA